MLSAHRWSSCPYLPAEHIVENLSCVFPALEVDSVEVPEEEQEEAGVVHLLAELGQHHVALLLVVSREQHRRYVSKLLAHLVHHVYFKWIQQERNHQGICKKPITSVLLPLTLNM